MLESTGKTAYQNIMGASDGTSQKSAVINRQNTFVPKIALHQ